MVILKDKAMFPMEKKQACLLFAPSAVDCPSSVSSAVVQIHSMCSIHLSPSSHCHGTWVYEALTQTSGCLCWVLCRLCLWPKRLMSSASSLKQQQADLSVFKQGKSKSQPDNTMRTQTFTGVIQEYKQLELYVSKNNHDEHFARALLCKTISEQFPLSSSSLTF